MGSSDIEGGEDRGSHTVEDAGGTGLVGEMPSASDVTGTWILTPDEDLADTTLPYPRYTRNDQWLGSNGKAERSLNGSDRAIPQLEPIRIPKVQRGIIREREEPSLLVWGTTFLAFVMAVAAITTGRILFKRMGIQSQNGGLPLDCEALECYAKELDKGQTELEQAWGRASAPVKAAFATLYVPGAPIKPPACPLGLFLETLEALRALERPTAVASDADKRTYALRLRLATAAVRAATVRLTSLMELQEFAENRNVQLPLIAMMLQGRPSEDVLKKETADLVSFPEFLEMVEGGNIPAGAPSAEKMIPRTLANHLAVGVQFARLRRKQGQSVHKCFDDFLSAFGTVKPLGSMMDMAEMARKIPLAQDFEDFSFVATCFSSLMSGIDRLTGDAIPYPEALASWVNDWTVPGALRRLHELDGATLFVHSTTAQMKLITLQCANMCPAPGVDELLPLAVALL